MPEGRKMVQSSPASAGAGDISERELSRERCNLLTPPARIQRVHPKKQLFSTPVNKFTAKAAMPSPNLARIRTCLDELRQTPARASKIGPKAVSMEDLTPNKRMRREGSDNPFPRVALPPLHGEEEQAALKIGVFMLVASWRRRREELRCVRKTLEFQVSCSERLRIQVCALKSLLDSDNAKVRLAMKELERLKQLLRDKDLEKAVLEKEKHALEQDICASEDRASEMGIGWRNCRDELAGARAAQAREASARRAALQRAARADRTIASLEEELSQRAEQVSQGAAAAAALRAAGDDLRREREARSRAEEECSELSARVALNAQEVRELSARVCELSAELERARRRWLPAPLYRLTAAARAWLAPRSLGAAALWALAPARLGC
ncbi:unnamed protein product, partial [Brenthis ino]